MTPLDFRLTAALQFRLLAYMCSNTRLQVNQLVASNLVSQQVSARALSQTDLTIESDVLQAQIQTEIQNTNVGSIGVQNLMLIVQQSHVYPIFNTNAFRFNVPGSEQYDMLQTFYPRHRNARFSNVCTHHSYCRSL